MKIRILASGEIRHIDNSTGSALVSAGLAESLSATDDKPGRLPRAGDAVVPQPIWEVVVIKSAQPVLAIRMTIGTQDALYTGDPKKVNARVEWNGGGRFTNGFGREVPEEIAKQYAKQWKSNDHLRAVGGFSDPDTRDAFSSTVNTVGQQEKEAFDREVANGNVPFTRVVN